MALTLQPIGYLHATEEFKYELPPQPEDGRTVEGVIQLETGQSYDVALRDLEGFSRIWILWWFHKNENWRPTTLPPRGRTARKGTFATRSPYRPNPLALSCVELLGVDQLKLFVGGHDLLSGTPILDIKPYIPEFDSFPEAKGGWYEEMTTELAGRRPYEIIFDCEVEPDLKEVITEKLRLDPFPHRTRRVVKFDDGFRLSCGDYRVFFDVQDETVRIHRVCHRESLEAPDLGDQQHRYDKKN